MYVMGDYIMVFGAGGAACSLNECFGGARLTVSKLISTFIQTKI